VCECAAAFLRGGARASLASELSREMASPSLLFDEPELSRTRGYAVSLLEMPPSDAAAKAVASLREHGVRRLAHC